MRTGDRTRAGLDPAIALAVALLLGCQGVVAVRAATVNLGVGLPADSLPPLIRVLRTVSAQRPAAEFLRTARAERDSVFGTAGSDEVLRLLVTEAVLEARVLTGQGADSSVLATFDSVLHAKRARFGTTHPEVARTLLGKAGYRARMFDDHRGAVALAMEADQIGRRYYRPEEPAYARILMRLGGFRLQAGEYVSANEDVMRALTIAERSSVTDSNLVALCHSYLSGIQGRLGDADGSAFSARRSLEILERMDGPTSRTVAMARVSHAIALSVEDLPSARAEFERAIPELEAHFPADHLWVEGARFSLATICFLLGDDRPARELMEGLIDVPRGEEVTELSAAAGVYTWLGIFDLNDGRLTEAEANLRHAVGLMDRAGLEQHPDLGTFLEPYAIALALNDKRDEALAAIERARAIQLRRTESGNSSFLGSMLLDESAIHEMAGADAESRRALHEALAQCPDSTDLATLFVWRARVGLARLDARAGRRQQAFDAALNLERARRVESRRAVMKLPERQALRFLATHEGGLELALELVTEPTGLAVGSIDRAYDEVIRSRALALDALAANRHHTVKHARREDAAAWVRWDAARRRWNAFRMSPPEALPGREREARSRALRQEMEQAEVALRGPQKPAEPDFAETAGLSDVRLAMPRGSALIGYLRARRPVSHLGVSIGNVRRGDEARYLAFIVPASGGAIQVFELGEAEAIDDLAVKWSALCSPGRVGGDPRAIRTVGDQLRSRIWDPLQQGIAGAEQIFVVRDGAIADVNLASLPVGADGWLIEEPMLLTSLATERDLVEADRPGPAGPSGRRLIVGAVDFDARSEPAANLGSLEGESAREEATGPSASQAYRGVIANCSEFRSRRFESLPATRGELEDVRLALADGQEQEGVEVLRGSIATEEVVKLRAPGSRSLHLATHGFVYGSDCPGDFLTRGRSGPRLAVGSDALLIDNPLTRCGLALAGANRRADAGSDEDDGLLTGDEIAALDLSGVEFVVLSACNTGVGEVLDGEGVLGLQRAFKIAGAGPVVMSLWPVEDQVARQWMRHFYEARLSEGATTAEATRRASLAMLAERRRLGLSTRPSSWAPFVSVGLER